MTFSETQREDRLRSASRLGPPRTSGVRGVALRYGLRCLTGCAAILGTLGRRVRRPRSLPPSWLVLATAAFSSPNWIRAHIEPITLSAGCRGVVLVATDPAPELDGLAVVRPHRLLTALLGQTAARLLTFVWIALRRRPEVLVGFHLLVNGMVAIVVACLLGRRSVYFCGGGQTEVMDGGAWGENRLFGRLPGPDAVIERGLLRCIALCDVTVTMGTRAATYLRGRGVQSAIEVLPGGHRLAPRQGGGACDQTWDCVFVGRLVNVKRVDRLLLALALARRDLPGLTALIVGDGPLRRELEAEATELGIEDMVTFAGQQDNINHWLSRSRLFVLTSDSEGVPQAIMEAFASGLPAVAADVGDVGDIVSDGVNGCLIASRDPSDFAERIVCLLKDAELLRQYGVRAMETARRFDVTNVSSRWQAILSRFGQSGITGPERGESAE